MLGTALTGLGALAMPTAAFADCVAGSGVLSTLVTCQSSGTLGAGGWNGSATNGLTIQVLSSNDGTNIVPTVTTPPTGSTTLLSAGTNSSLANFGGSFGDGTATVFGIDAGSDTNPAISMGGGSTGYQYEQLRDPGHRDVRQCDRNRGQHLQQQLHDDQRQPPT